MFPRYLRLLMHLSNNIPLFIQQM